MSGDDKYKDSVIRYLLAWAEERMDVRAVIWTSSRTSSHAPVDQFSDYDIILVVQDIHPFFESRIWLEDFGRVLVLYRDPIQLEYGFERFAYITQYEDGLKIDFTLWSLGIPCKVAEDPQVLPDLDVGYKILLDKDGLTEGWKPPTYKAYIPSPPSVEAYLTEIEVFFHEATYAAKHLWRDDLMPAKNNLDKEMKADNLRQMLEWRIEIDHGWAIKPGAYGRFLKQRLDPEIWSELECTYVGSGIEENWEAIFRTIDLFQKVAIDVGDHLGYEYPQDLHARVLRYLHKVKTFGR